MIPAFEDQGPSAGSPADSADVAVGADSSPDEATPFEPPAPYEPPAPLEPPPPLEPPAPFEPPPPADAGPDPGAAPAHRTAAVARAPVSRVLRLASGRAACRWRASPAARRGSDAVRAPRAGGAAVRCRTPAAPGSHAASGCPGPPGVGSPGRPGAVPGAPHLGVAAAARLPAAGTGWPSSRFLHAASGPARLGHPARGCSSQPHAAARCRRPADARRSGAGRAGGGSR